MDLNQPKVLLFDLGGVIVPWVGIIELSRLTGQSEAEILAIAADMPIFSAYEIGDCTTAEFLEHAPKPFGLDVSQKDFAALWNKWVRPPYPGTREALLDLKVNYHLACLSNTNQSHWDYVTAQHNILDVFDHAYASHLIKAAKPHPSAWEIVLEDMSVNSKDVWFFDDTQANIQAAQKLGIKSFIVNRDIGVLPLLRELGLLTNGEAPKDI